MGSFLTMRYAFKFTLDENEENIVNRIIEAQKILMVVCELSR